MRSRHNRSLLQSLLQPLPLAEAGDGALRLLGWAWPPLVQQLAGTAEAQRVGRELAYPGWSLDGPTGIPAQRPAPRDLANLLAALAPWRRPALGVGFLPAAAAHRNRP